MISIKSAGSRRIKSGFRKFFLLLLTQQVSLTGITDINLFFSTNAQVGLIVEGARSE
jgi:hypothetical protein